MIRRTKNLQYLSLGDPVLGQLYHGEVAPADRVLDLVESDP